LAKHLHETEIAAGKNLIWAGQRNNNNKKKIMIIIGINHWFLHKVARSSTESRSNSSFEERGKPEYPEGKALGVE